jgi:hypothetical protein
VPNRLYQLAKEQAHVVQDHLASGDRLLRQGSSFYLKQLDLQVNLTMCEPVLQGRFHKDRSSLTILGAPHLDMAHTNGHTADDDMNDLSIDESFLSAEMLEDASDEDEADDLQSVASLSSSANGNLKNSTWHLAQASALHRPVPPELCPEVGPQGSDLCVFTRTRHLARLGMQNGDLVLLRGPAGADSSHIGRLFASDLLFDDHSNADILVPPLLLFSVLGHVSHSEPPYVEVRLLGRSESLKSIPIAASVTLARVSTALTSQKMYQNVFYKALKQYLQQKSGQVVVRQGDLLAVPLDEAEARWSEEESWE